MKKHGWRWWFHVIHRDVGYLCVGLTLVYAVSGVAVNHINDWNPNYVIEHVRSNIGPVDAVDDAEAAEVILARLELPPDYRTLFVPAPGQLQVFRDNHTITVERRTGAVLQEFVSTRLGLHEANKLHLNHPKRLWTWVADAYAVALIALAITGMFLIKGKKGIKGRGAWLTAAGVAIPVFFLWLYG